MLNHLHTILRPLPDDAHSDMAENHDEMYDLVTIGAGSGGVRASRVAASKYGKKVGRVLNTEMTWTCCSGRPRAL